MTQATNNPRSDSERVQAVAAAIRKQVGFEDYHDSIAADDICLWNQDESEPLKGIYVFLRERNSLRRRLGIEHRDCDDAQYACYVVPEDSVDALAKAFATPWAAAGV